MKINFTKMEGLGNDYVYIDCTKNELPNPSELAIKFSDRHFGIGSDGLILIKSSSKADFTMEMYNADGSQSEMCGNGIRCVAKYVYDYGLTDKTEVAIETLAGIKYLKLKIEKEDGCDRGKVSLVTVNMGAPVLKPELVPTTIGEGKEMAVSEPVQIDGVSYPVSCVSMGNPHSVVFVDDVDHFPLDEIGPKFEGNTKLFPKRVNAEFVQIVDRTHAKMRVWERGTGETLACGTGTCASVVAAILNGMTDDEVTVKLLGGELIIRWDRETDVVYMTGPAATVYDGVIEV